MARNTGPKNKKSRRIGMDLGHKTNPAKLQRRLNIPPGQHGRKGSRKLSDYGIQLKEKQKVRWMYGVLERQFKRYMDKALKNRGATGTELLRLLELRLDNVVYRLSLAPTRPAARQLVTHGHVRVNNQKVDRPSYQVQVGDVIRLSKKALNIPAVDEIAEDVSGVPEWLLKKGKIGNVKAMPERSHIDADINESLIVEYYSR